MSGGNILRKMFGYKLYMADAIALVLARLKMLTNGPMSSSRGPLRSGVICPREKRLSAASYSKVIEIKIKLLHRLYAVVIIRW